MKFDFLSRFVHTRSMLKALNRLATAQEQQVVLLGRLADRFAPLPLADPTKQDLVATGPSYGRDEDYARIEQFIEKCEKDLKRPPTEEEVADFLDGRELRI